MRGPPPWASGDLADAEGHTFSATRAPSRSRCRGGARGQLLALRRLYHEPVAAPTDTRSTATGDAGRGSVRNVVVLLLDSLNRHMLGSYGGAEFYTPHLDRFARERAVRFTSHVTGSLPCMPARHDILCGSPDFLWWP
jgi:Sulfatase